MKHSFLVILLEGLAKSFRYGLAVSLLCHINKINKDDAAQTPQPHLLGNGLAGL